MTKKKCITQVSLAVYVADKKEVAALVEALMANRELLPDEVLSAIDEVIETRCNTFLKEYEAVTLYQGWLETIRRR